MNRIYNLVWNRALRTLQVASELARAHVGGGASGTGASILTLRRHPLVLACVAVLALGAFAAPAWSQICTPSATQTCGSAGGGGGAGNGGYGGYGGVGNGGGAQGGGDGGPSAAGAIGTGGNGGAGSAGDPQNPGGAGGSVGATSIGSTSVQGGDGVTPPAGGNASRGSGGGGGGGAGVYTTDTNLDLAAGLSIHGGDGGDGALGDTMGGGGGGGGAGVMAVTAATTFTNAGTIAGGDGGDGAAASWSGGGGGGGDGVLLAGTGSTLTNTGSIAGGAGGDGPAAGYFFGTGGEGGTGVNATTDNIQITNSGSITGGAAPMRAGAGVITTSGIKVNNFTGNITGGAASDSGSFGGDGISAIASGSASVTIGNAAGATIQGGAGGTNAEVTGFGGQGIDVDAFEANIDNYGTIEGGQGGGVSGGGGTGGVGVEITAPNGGVAGITNESGGIIQGGYGGVAGSGDNGGIGISADGSVSITNDAGASILGDSAGVDDVSFNGGVGINASNGVVIDNSGTIAGTGSTSFAGSAINAYDTEINNYAGGVIQAGNGSGTGNANGGDAIIGTGKTAVVNAGSIIGGSAVGTGVAGDAVFFSGGGNSLVLEVGSTETGNIVSTSGTVNGGDTLTLGDNSAGGGSDSLDIGTVSGFLTFLKTGTSTWTLTGSTTDTTTWDIRGGTLAVSSDGNLGAAAGFVALEGGTLEVTQSFSSARAVDVDRLGGGGTIQTDDGVTLTLTGTVSGLGSLLGLVKAGAGTLVLGGSNTFSGGTTVNAGTLRVSSDDNLGADIGALTFNGGTLENTAAFTFAHAIDVGAGGGTLLTDADLTSTAAISGSGALAKTGTAAWMVDGDGSAFTGGTTVSAGGLFIGSAAGNGAALGGGVNVSDGATLGGFGAVGGASNTVELASGGVLSPGNGAGSMGTLTVGGGLTLDAGSVLDFDFGAPDASDPQTTPGLSDHLDVTGALDFEGAATLNLNNAGGIGPGLYNLASYGSLAANGCSFSGGTACIAVGTLPQGTSASQFNIVNNTQGSQIDLYNTAGLTLNLWDPSGDPAQLGGTGTWSATSPTWTDTAGDGPFAMAPQPGFAIFQGTPGTVTVDAGAGAVSVTGMQFAVDGYTLTGDAVTLVGSGGNAPIIEVGDGSSASAGMTASIQNTLNATGGFTKTGAGTLVLDVSQRPGAGVSVQGGTLQLGNAPAYAAGLYTAVTMASGTHLVLDFGGVINGYGAAAAVSGQDFSIAIAAADASSINGIWGGTLGMSPTGNAVAAAIAGSGFTASFSGNTTIAGASSLSAGGAGAPAITGSGFYVSNSAAGAVSGSVAPGIRGGAGGYSAAGTGGTGGAGITGSGFTVFNTGGIYGGAGGATQSGTAGLGGAGVYSTGGATVINEGTISGGRNPDGSYADAIEFTGGGNTLELVAGHPGTLNGALVVTRAAGDAADTLALGGDSGSDTFDLAQLASGGLYDGFNAEAKSGASTWTLTGTGSSSEDWTIEGGTLVGDATTFQGSIAFAPASGETATVEFNQGSGNANSTANATYAGVISGEGDFVKSGDGTLTLTGANTYSGGTTISAGTLQVGDGGTTGSIGTGAITDNGTLVFDRSDAVTLTQTISGNGAINQSNPITLTVNGDGSAFGGTTNIAAGNLVVGDDAHTGAVLGGMVNVAKGATISGAGTVGGLDLSGTLLPGDPGLGTFNVSGNATFEAGSTFQLTATPAGQAGKLAVGGKATIKGGNTLVIAQPGNWAPQTTYTILTAGQGVSGKFESVSDDQAFLTPTLGYGAKAVTLTLARNQVAFPDVAATPNEQGVAAGIEGIGTGNALYDAVVKLNATDARVAFDQTSGEYHASQQTARIEDSRYIREAMNQRLRNGDADPEADKVGNLTAWAHAWGHWGTTDGDGNAAKLSDNGDGLLIGADMPVGTQARVGVTGGASRNSLSIANRDSWGRETSTWLGAFAGYAAGAFGLRSGIAYAWDRIPTSRDVAFPGYTDRLSDNATGDTLTGFIEGSWTFHFTHGSITPFLNVAHSKVETDASTEAGGAAALRAASDSSNVSFSTLGARGQIKLVHHLDLHGELGWQHAFGDTTPESNLQFVAGGPGFTVYGVPIAKNAGLGRIGIGWHHANVAIDADYEGLAGNGVKDQAAKLSVSVTF